MIKKFFNLNFIKSFVNQYLYTISLYLRKVSSTIVVFIIARILSVQEYGIYSAYNTISTFLLLFVTAGIEQYILVSAKNIPNRVHSKLQYFLLYSISLMILYMFILQFLQIDNKIILTLLIARNFFDGSFFTLILPYFQSTKKFKKIANINMFYSFCIILIALITYIFKLNLMKYLICNVFLGIFNFLQCSIYIKFNFLYAIKHFVKFLKTIDKSFKYYMITTITITLYYQMSALMISFFMPRTEVALYFAAFNIAAIINVFVTAQQQQIFPDFIKRSKDVLKKLIISNCKLIIYINSLLFLFFTLFGKQLLLLIYGNEYYLNSYGILLILSLATTVYAVASIFGLFITAQGMQKLKFKIQIETIIFSLFTTIILYRFGLYGLAVAQILNYIYIFSRYLFSTYQRIKQL